MNLRHVLLAAGLAGSLWLTLSGGRAPANGMSGAVERVAAAAKPAAPAMPASGSSAPKTNADVLELQARETLIGGAGAGAAGSTLFESRPWTPPPATPSIPPSPPAAPALPYSYVGKKFDGARWEVYLARGDESFIGREGAVLHGVYRIASIKPPTLSLVYLPLNAAQTLTIGEAD